MAPKRNTVSRPIGRASDTSGLGRRREGPSTRTPPVKASSPTGKVKKEIGLFDPERIELAWSRVGARFEIGGGLHNLGNTCFLNSVLQCVTYTPPIAALALKGELAPLSNRKSSKRFCPLCAVEHHIKRVLSLPNGALAPTNIVRNLRAFSTQFRPGRQEDAHEFLRYLVEGLHQSCLPLPEPSFKVAETSFFHRVFGGKLRSQIKCQDYVSNTYEPFLDLSLEVSRADSLEVALKRFTAPEILDGPNKYYCEKYKKRMKATKRFTVEKAPPVLAVHLKRFDFTRNFGGAKIDRRIKFPQRLDIRPYMSETHEGKGVYELYAVLVHSGRSTRCGHYYCFVKGSCGSWFAMDDSHVRQVSEQTVMEQRAYLLFYVSQVDGSNGSPETSTGSPASPSKSGCQKSSRKEDGRSAPGLHLLSNGLSKQGDLSSSVKETVHGTASSNGDLRVQTPKKDVDRGLGSDERAASLGAEGARLKIRVKEGGVTSMPNADWDNYYSTIPLESPSPKLCQLLRVIPHSRRYFMTRNAAKARRQAIVSREAAIAMTSKLMTRSAMRQQLSSITEGLELLKPSKEGRRETAMSTVHERSGLSPSKKLRTTSSGGSAENSGALQTPSTPPHPPSTASLTKVSGSAAARLLQGQEGGVINDNELAPKWAEVPPDVSQQASRLQRTRKAPKRMRDEWDEEYDKGRVRKVKKATANLVLGHGNAFQEFANAKTERNHRGRRTPSHSRGSRPGSKSSRGRPTRAGQKNMSKPSSASARR